MKDESSGQRNYYQAIARHLFNLRRAPLILSAQEIDVIEEWEKHHIPLYIVLEGIKSAHEHFKEHNWLRKGFDLTFCSGFVLNAFRQYRERKVGGKSEGQDKDERIKTIKALVKKFVKDAPEEVGYLKEIYLNILDDLTTDDLNEDILERRDEQVDQLLLDKASKSSINQHKQEAESEYNAVQESEKTQVAHRKYTKNIRERYKIPYVSLFYY